MSALMLAADKGHVEVMKALLQAPGVNATLLDKVRADVCCVSTILSVCVCGFSLIIL